MKRKITELEEKALLSYEDTAVDFIHELNQEEPDLIRLGAIISDLIIETSTIYVCEGGDEDTLKRIMNVKTSNFMN